MLEKVVLCRQSWYWSIGVSEFWVCELPYNFPVPESWKTKAGSEVAWVTGEYFLLILALSVPFSVSFNTDQALPQPAQGPVYVGMSACCPWQHLPGCVQHGAAEQRADAQGLLHAQPNPIWNVGFLAREDYNPGTGKGLAVWKGEAFGVGAVGAEELVNDLMLGKKAENLNSNGARCPCWDPALPKPLFQEAETFIICFRKAPTFSSITRKNLFSIFR